MTNLDPLRTGKLDGTKSTECPAKPAVVPQMMPFAVRYRLEAPLGHGTASVFRAKDLKTGIRRAIKRLPPEAALSPGEYARFVSEVTLLSQLGHPNIVAMTELHRDDAGRPCLVMELLDGEDALTHLAGGQRLTLPRVLEITRQVTSALHAAHLSGIFHREFELSNIFLAMQRGLRGEAAEVVKVVGFGGVNMRTLAVQGARHGTGGPAEYQAPEAMTGQRSELDASSDQWSVAVVVYRMLSGRLPFQAADEASLRHQIGTMPPALLQELCPELPPHVVETLDRALSKDKAQRFPTLAEFIRALSGQAPSQVAAAGEPVALPMSTTTRAAEAPPVGTTARRSTRRELVNGSPMPGENSISEIPTIAMAVGTERTQTIEPAMLEQLRAQSQHTEDQCLNPRQPTHLESATPDSTLPQPTAMPPPLPGAWLMKRQGRETRRRQSLVLIISSCIGLSLGMSAAWVLGSRASRHQQKKALPVAAPSGRSQRPAVADATAQPQLPALACFALVAPPSLTPD